MFFYSNLQLQLILLTEVCRKSQMLWSVTWLYLMGTRYFYDAAIQYHIETSPLICRANQWTGFYMISDGSVIEISRAHKT